MVLSRIPRDALPFCFLKDPTFFTVSAAPFFYHLDDHILAYIVECFMSLYVWINFFNFQFTLNAHWFFQVWPLSCIPLSLLNPYHVPLNLQECRSDSLLPSIYHPNDSSIESWLIFTSIEDVTFPTDIINVDMGRELLERTDNLTSYRKWRESLTMIAFSAQKV